MKYMKFNNEEFLWRNDIEESVLLYRIGGEQIFTLKGKIKELFIEMISVPCKLDACKAKDFFTENGIFKEEDYNV